MTTAHPLHYDYAEYLAALEASRIKLEFCAGVIYAMAGGTRAHARLAASMIVALRRALPRRCQIATSDLKVRVEASDLTTFPDVSVVCGTEVTSSIDSHAVANPTLLVEVTSRSTEDYDRGEKLRHYQRLESLGAVLFVSHREPRITVVERTGSGWAEREHRSGEVIVLAEHDARFTVDEVYEGVELDSA